MKSWLVRHWVIWVAMASGGALTLAFPSCNWSWMGWFALAPLFLVMEERPFASGYAAGLVFFAGSLYWLNIVMTTYGGLHPFFSMVAWLMLAAYLALYFGAATFLACRWRRTLHIPWWLSLPVVWIAGEYLRAHLLTGFPWVSIGYSQQNFLTMIQTAELFGVYGIGFLLVFVNAALAWLLHSFRERRRFACGPLVLALLLVTLNAGYGFFRLHQPLDKRSRQLDVALVQGNVDQGLKWDPEFKAETITRYRKLSQKAAAAGADLIVWPESATPFYFGSHEPLTGAVLDVPVLCDLPLIFGAPSYEVGAHDRVRYFNSVFLASSQGEILGRSDKIHLVPFGEYNPLLWLLPSLGKLVHGLGDFSPGIAKPLLLGKTRIGTLICFEAVFPELARHWVRKEGCDLLVNVTNDAWFGRSAAPFQHIAMTTFRAVENRVWIARAANTGISALIAPSGRIGAATGLFEETIAQGQVGLGGTRTFYNRWGDIGPQLCVAATLLLAGLAMRRNRRQRTEPLRYHNNLGRRF